MNEKLQYASMLEIPINTCNVTYKAGKKRKKKPQVQTVEEVKNELVEKVNNTNLEQEVVEENKIEPTSEIIEKKEDGREKRKERLKSFKISTVAVELVIIAILAVTIILTNVFKEDSGINVFMKSVFSTETGKVDSRTYQDFVPVFSEGSVSVSENGVASVLDSGSVYSVLEGTVKDVYLKDDKYTVEIAHSESFVSVISGLDYAYAEKGESVKKNVPIGFVRENGYDACFLNDGETITDYTLENNSVVWKV